MIPRELIFFSTLFLVSCQKQPEQVSLSIESLRVKEVPTAQSGEPNLFIAENGTVFLSWIEYINDSTDALSFSTYENNQWTPARTIATGTDWFVNWADFPSMSSFSGDDNHLVAHWLQKRSEGTYDYDVHIAQSLDGGVSWSPSMIPHRDSIAAEHGFVSMLSLPNNSIFVTWLDGRNTKMTEHSEQDHDHQGAMTLRSAILYNHGDLMEEVEMDARVCDCCQTAATYTDDGVIVAYRDRSEDEIRDISIVRNIGAGWTAPRNISNDGWKIAGCPVNGPALDAINNSVALVWFSLRNENPEVNLKFSFDSGNSFTEPIRIDEGKPLGRVDVEMITEQIALVSWMEEANTGTAIRLALVNQEGILHSPITITQSDATRRSGFPRLAVKQNQVFMAWTEVEEGTKIRSATLNLIGLAD